MDEMNLIELFNFNPVYCVLYLNLYLSQMFEISTRLLQLFLLMQESDSESEIIYDRSKSEYSGNEKDIYKIRWTANLLKITGHDKFDEVKKAQVKEIYQKNMHLMLRYLNLKNKHFIIKFKKISMNAKYLSIRMQHGEDCWYKLESEASTEEKINYIMDVCKGLIQLSQLNIYQFDLNKENIVKVKHQYKLIDFEFALLLDKSPEKRRKNTMNHSKKIEDEVFDSSQKILQFELSEFFSQNKQICGFSNNLQKISCKAFTNIINSEISKTQKIKLGLQFFRTRAESLNARHFSFLLKSVFSAEQIQEIDKYRRSFIKRSDIRFCGLQDLIKDLRKSLDSNIISPLKVFYTKFRLSCQTSSRKNVAKDKELMILNEKAYIDIWNERFVSLVTNRHELPEESSFEPTIIHYPYQVNLHKIFNYPNSRALEMEYQNRPDSFFKRHEQRGVDHLQEAIKFLELKKDYQSFKISLLRYLSNNSLAFPEKFAHILPIYHPNVSKYSILSYNVDFEGMNHFTKSDANWKIEHLWEGGLKKVVKFISHIAQGIIQLENQGIYHPQIDFDATTECRLYRIGRLEKAYAAEFKQHPEADRKELDRLTSTLLSNFLKIGQKEDDQRLQYERNLYNQIKDQFPDLENNTQSSYFQELSQVDNYIFSEADVIQKKLRILKIHINANYQRYHALKFGDMLQKLLQYGWDIRVKQKKKEAKLKLGESLNQKIYIPQYEQENFNRMIELVGKLNNQTQTDSLNVRTFLTLFKKIFSFCEHHPQSLAVYSFQEENSRRRRVCDECLPEIIDRGVISQLICSYHKKIISYIEVNEDIMGFMTKRYYCQECFRLLESFNEFKRIDTKDLQQCEYLCMSLGCNENLISRENKEINHANHKILQISKITKLYNNFKAEDQESSTSWMSRIYQAIKGKLSGCMKFHFEAIDDIFLSLMKFNRSSDFLEETLVSLKVSKFAKFDKAEPTMNKDFFFKLIKTISSLQEAKKQSGMHSSLPMSRCFIQYMVEAYRKIGEKIYQKISSILKNATDELEQQIFNKDPKQLYQGILEFLSKKYEKVVNLEEKVCTPAPILQVSKMHNNFVESVIIEQPQSDLQTYYKLRQQLLAEIQQKSIKKINTLHEMAQIVKEEDLDSDLLDFQRKYDNYIKNVKENFFNEQTKLTKLMNSLTQIQFQKCNREALSKKKQNLRFEIREFNDISQRTGKMISLKKKFNPERNQEKQIGQWEKIKIKLIEDIKSLIEKINLQGQAFRYQIRILPLTLHQNITEKIIKMPNLKELSLITNRNYGNHFMNIDLDREYLMTASLLKSIYSNCKKLERLYLKGGYMEIQECLQTTMQFNNRENFQLYLHSANAVSELQQLKAVSQLLSMKFKVPTLRIRLKKMMTEEEQFYILSILDKLSELQLEVEGPFLKNGHVLELLNNILNRKDLTLKTLLLKRVKLEKHQELLQGLSAKSQLSEVVLLLCKTYPRTVFFANQSDHLTYLFVKGENTKPENSQTQKQKMTIPNEFLKGLLQFSKLKSLKLNNIDITDKNRINFSLSNLSQLKLISLRNCTWFGPQFLGSLPEQAIGQIETLDLQACMQMKGASSKFLQPIQRMKELKYININFISIEINVLLNLQTEKLEVLKLRQYSSITDRLVLLFDKKWPNLRCLDLNRCINVTMDVFKQENLQKLREVFLTPKLFTFKDKQTLFSRKIIPAEYN